MHTFARADEIKHSPCRWYTTLAVSSGYLVSPGCVGYARRGVDYTTLLTSVRFDYARDASAKSGAANHSWRHTIERGKAA